MADYGNALKRPFSDFGKFIIGCLLSIIPIVNFFAKGYILESSGVSKRRISPRKMPDWNRWGDLFVRGLLSWIIGFIYFLPALIVFLVGAGAFLMSLFTAFTPLLSQDLTNTEMESVFMNNLDLVVNSILAAGPFIVIGGLLGIFAAYLIPVATLNYVRTDRFGDAFKFGIVFKRAFRSDYFAAWLVVGVVSIVAYIILSYIPFIGVGVAFFYTGMFTYTVLGGVYSKMR